MLPAMKAHGVPWLIRHLDGEISLEKATDGAVIDTRRYAKRQVTWFRNQIKDWPWAPPARPKKCSKVSLPGFRAAVAPKIGLDRREYPPL